MFIKDSSQKLLGQYLAKSVVKMFTIKIIESWYVKLIKSVPFLLACAVFLTVITFNSPTLLFCLLIAGFVTTTIQQIGQKTHLPKQWIVVCQVLAVSLILSSFWLDYFADPALAQFFGKAETFFKNSLTQGSAESNTATPAISLIFNVLRALYLLYIAISLVGVINAVRKDDDWQVVARTPLMVVIAVTIADVLTGFITG
jgi:hypothetical protein